MATIANSALRKIRQSASDRYTFTVYRMKPSAGPYVS